MGYFSPPPIISSEEVFLTNLVFVKCSSFSPDPWTALLNVLGQVQLCEAGTHLWKADLPETWTAGMQAQPPGRDTVMGWFILSQPLPTTCFVMLHEGNACHRLGRTRGVLHVSILNKGQCRGWMHAWPMLRIGYSLLLYGAAFWGNLPSSRSTWDVTGHPRSDSTQASADILCVLQEWLGHPGLNLWRMKLKMN